MKINKSIDSLLHRVWVRAVENGYLSGTQADFVETEAKQQLITLIESILEEVIPEKMKPSNDEFLAYDHGYAVAIDDTKAKAKKIIERLHGDSNR